MTIDGAEIFSEFEATLRDAMSNHIVKGIIKKITTIGIYVDIGQESIGFVPMNEYSANPNADTVHGLKIGDTLELLVMDTQETDGIVKLSKRLCDLQKPWLRIVEAEENGTVLEGTVSEIVQDGMIVIRNGVRIFIPASLASERKDVPLKSLLNKTVRFRIIEVNKQKQEAVGSVVSVPQETKNETVDSVDRNIFTKGYSTNHTPWSAVDFDRMSEEEQQRLIDEMLGCGKDQPAEVIQNILSNNQQWLKNRKRVDISYYLNNETKD